MLAGAICENLCAPVNRPMRIWENATVVTAAAVFAVALGVFAATLAPTVTLVDSGELIVAAWSAGLSLRVAY